VISDFFNQAVVKAEPAQAEPVKRKIWNEFNHPLGLPTLATMFQPGMYPITRNLMSYLHQSDVEILKTASKGIDEQLHDNLHHVPPPRWTCDAFPRFLRHAILNAPCPATASIKPCDGTELKLDGRSMLSTKAKYHGGHGPDHCVCSECKEQRIGRSPAV